MDPITQQVVLATAGAAGAADPTYVDDVFSTFLYTGTGSARTITNGIDLSGEGGLVWIKNRDSSAYNHCLFDTERGATKFLISNSSAYQFTTTNSLTGFNSDGFNLGSYGDVNANTLDICSWTFRKAPGFFDIQTWTGDATSGRNISHNLGSVPGMILIKKTDTVYENWAVYHRGIGAGKFLTLNTNDDEEASTDIFGNTAPTSTVFTVGMHGRTNQLNNTYIAYIFAHDDQSFGTDSDEAIIKCGSYTGNGSGAGPVIDLGFEPQWLLIKKTSSGDAGTWTLLDNMRGIAASGDDARLYPNNTDPESNTQPVLSLTSTGFQLKTAGNSYNSNAATYIYMAIRRPHKPPTAGTEVFEPVYRTSVYPNLFNTSLFYVDTTWNKLDLGTNWLVSNRLTGSTYMSLSTTAQEASTSHIDYDYNYKVKPGTMGSGYNEISYLFKRASGFFDVVTYKGSSSTQSISHNLAAKPELIIFKPRNQSGGAWVQVFDIDSSGYKNLYAFFNDSGTRSYGNTIEMYAEPSSTNLYLGSNNSTNNSSYNYVAYLFSSLDGISKIGTYSGTGSNINVDCGFTAGARLVMIKAFGSGSTGTDWYVWDTARGIVSGNDPYFLLNSNAAQVTNTDYIDPLNAGFTVTSSAPAALNTSGGTYLFLAIA